MVCKPLDNCAGRYETISYAWEGSVKSHTLAVYRESDTESGDRGSEPPYHKLLITASLHAALCRVRQPSEARLLWADAVCINQSDEAEKASQVTMMGDIYALAQRALVYLGPHAASSELVPGLLAKIARVGHLPVFQQPAAHELPSRFLVAMGLPPDEDPAWAALRTFFGRPWFRRVWVIQEYARSPDVRIFCGDWEESWSLLHAAVTCSWLLHRVVPTERTAFDVGRFVVGAGTFHFMNELRGRLLMATLAGMDWQTQGLWIMNDGTLAYTAQERLNDAKGSNPALQLNSDDSLDLLTLLTLGDRSEATRARDHLFALRALASDASDDPLFRPDYTAPFEQVVGRYGKAFVRKGQGMELLYEARLNLQSTRFPSWIPDWTTKHNIVDLTSADYLSLGRHGKALYSAAGNTTPELTVDDAEDGCLVARGRSFDTVTCIVADHMAEGWIHGFLCWLLDAYEMANMCASETYLSTGEPPRVAMWRTLVANKTTDHLPAPPDFGDGFISAFDDLPEYLDRLYSLPEQDMRSGIVSTLGFDCYNAMYGYFRCYRLAMTKGGFFCLVPHRTELGDQVCVLNGGAVPFVLTKRGAPEQGYRLVGECYVHGVMGGESWPRLKEEVYSIY
jgi:hypothetical protein